MPLKKPKEIPKIHKTRKKKTDSILATIPDKKPDKIEYNCMMSFQFEETEPKQYAVITIETEAEFSTFAYKVSVEVSRERNEFYIFLMGLSAEPNFTQNIGPAKTLIPFEDLVGDFTINVVKQDGAINSAEYHLNIYKREITISNDYVPEKENNRRFCNFSIDTEAFSFSDDLL